MLEISRASWKIHMRVVFP